MHLTDDLCMSMFAVEVAGLAGTLDRVLPGLGPTDRLGIVSRTPCAAVGASALIMAFETFFYDHHRADLPTLRIYPEIFIFSVAGRDTSQRGARYGPLDVWPPHREVAVADDPEQVLEAVNDRGVTRLLVEDARPRDSLLLRETVASAESRILTTLAFSASGDTSGGEIGVTGNAVTETCVQQVLDKARQEGKLAETPIARPGTPAAPMTETYRQLSLMDAITRLARGDTADLTHDYVARSAPGSAAVVRAAS